MGIINIGGNVYYEYWRVWVLGILEGMGIINTGIIVNFEGNLYYEYY